MQLGRVKRSCATGGARQEVCRLPRWCAGSLWGGRHCHGGQRGAKRMQLGSWLVDRLQRVSHTLRNDAANVVQCQMRRSCSGAASSVGCSCAGTDGGPIGILQGWSGHGSDFCMCARGVHDLRTGHRRLVHGGGGRVECGARVRNRAGVWVHGSSCHGVARVRLQWAFDRDLPRGSGTIWG